MQENPIPPIAVRWKRQVLTSLGCLSLATGVVGAFVPVLPTTCFLLLAAACFSRSSPRLNSWMKTNRWFGRYLAEYRESGRIDVKVKFGSLIVLWASLFISAGILGWNPWATALLFCTGAGVSLHVGSIGTRSADEGDCNNPRRLPQGSAAAAIRALRGPWACARLPGLARLCGGR